MADEIPISDDNLFLETVRGYEEGQRLFNRYVLNRVLGRGGMGIVWLATDEKLELSVALKLLPEVIKLDAKALDQLKRETSRSLDLTHTHIVRTYGLLQDQTVAAISMEYIDGYTLSTLRVEQPHRVFETAQLAGWVTQMIEALEYAHRTVKLVHRDLKPANLLVTVGGELKVADFGIAQSIDDSIGLDLTQSSPSGSLVYMSPQQAMRESPQASDDIYAFGVTIYELLTSKPPFYRGDILRQLNTIIPPSMRERRVELEIQGTFIPPEWEKTIAACLAKDPKERPESMAKVGQMLGLLDTKKSTRKVQPPVKAAPIPIAPPKEMPTVWAAGIVAGVIMLAMAAWCFGVERFVEREKSRLAESAQQEAILKDTSVKASDEAEIARQKAEEKKATDEAEALRNEQEKAKADADAQAARDATVTKVAADQKAADEATKALAVAQRAANDTAETLAAQKAADAASAGDSSGPRRP